MLGLLEHGIQQQTNDGGRYVTIFPASDFSTSVPT